MKKLLMILAVAAVLAGSLSQAWAIPSPSVDGDTPSYSGSRQHTGGGSKGNESDSSGSSGSSGSSVSRNTLNNSLAKAKDGDDNSVSFTFK